MTPSLPLDPGEDALDQAPSPASPVVEGELVPEVLAKMGCMKLPMPNGDVIWFDCFKIHREGDEPAVLRADGTVEYWKQSMRHREGGPAIIFPDGTELWYREDVLHRRGGPAVTHADGTVEYWEEGVRLFATPALPAAPAPAPGESE